LVACAHDRVNTGRFVAAPVAGRGLREAGVSGFVRAVPHFAVPALPHLLAVQVLRALAALAVAMQHVQSDAAAVAARSGAPFTRSELLPWLAGVDVFFVISGFIMVHASAGLFGRNGAAATFLGRRIARIVPLYWAVTTAFLIVAALAPQVLNSGTPGPWQIAASFLFIPATRGDGLVQPVFSLGWTLNYEMFFYVVFAAAIGLPMVRAVTAVAVVLGLAVIAGRVFAQLPQPLAFWSDSIVLEFAFGMGLGLLRAAGAELGLPVRIVLAAVAVLLLHIDLTRGTVIAPLPVVAAYGIPATLLVAAAALGRAPRRPPRFERALATLGDASYALYLLHPFAMRLLRELFVRSGFTNAFAASPWGPWAYVGLALATAVVAAILVYRWFERPVTRALRARLDV